jgi:hypothetical protein
MLDCLASDSSIGGDTASFVIIVSFLQILYVLNSYCSTGISKIMRLGPQFELTSHLTQAVAAGLGWGSSRVVSWKTNCATVP